MKVLLFNRNPKLWIGGDAVQVEKTREALIRKGIICNFAYTQDYPLNEHDITHVFNINFDWTKTILTRLMKEKRPYIISAIFFPQVFASTFDEMREFINNSVYTIALSDNEKKEIEYFTMCDKNKVIVVPNGIDKGVFFNKGLIRDDVVVSVGRIQPMKGVQYLIEACKKLNRPLRYISSECEGGEARQIRSLIDEYHQNIPQEQVSDLLNTARVYVCPSKTERQSLGVLEAAACGLPIVDSIFNRGHKLLPSSIVVDPRNIGALAMAIDKQWDAPVNTDPVPSWDDVADQLITIYRSYVKS